MPRYTPLLITLLIAGSLAPPARAGGSPRVGEAAPTFEAIDDRGNAFESADLQGRKKLVIFFYPGDMTQGCTHQAAGYRDVLSRLWALDTVVVGISGDTAENHRIFRRVNDINFTLIPDPEGKIAELFGVPFGKGGEVSCTLGGKEETFHRAGTASRRTFVIDENGIILHADEDVDPAEDGKKVLDLLRSQP